jgi:hypothetical protein
VLGFSPHEMRADVECFNILAPALGRVYSEFEASEIQRICLFNQTHSPDALKERAGLTPSSASRGEA